MNNKTKPLNILWFHCPVKILGIHFSYDEKRNNELNFRQKIRKLQTKLNMWSSRDLTIFGRAMILKILGLSQLVYSASNLVVPPGIVDLVKTKLFIFLWRKRKDKMKRSCLNQDQDRGGICVTDTNIILNALKLACIPRLIKSYNSNWCTIPNHFFKRMGGRNFLLRFNYDTRHFNDLLVFYKRILDNFKELKNLDDYYQKQDIILFSNKKILIDWKQMFRSEWFKEGINSFFFFLIIIISIRDLLDETGNLLTLNHFHLNIHAKPVFYNIIKCSAPFLSTSCP